MSYLTNTQRRPHLQVDTTIYIRSRNSKVIGIFSINYDITELMDGQMPSSPTVTSKEDKVSRSRMSRTSSTTPTDESTRQVGNPSPHDTGRQSTDFIKFLNDQREISVNASRPAT